ncbi:retinol dehydrogenase 11-like [Daphnia pulicaria]|uniref:retinol dehydrogenase 11-like n=1 Tax=Daphnia pulicaria TaxID=35523 RepID=UPI001EEAE133|nr:retinol dehydrogenase 11-like [Daphnia pulicaria]XP_046651857.1 retinol dehydrogenase 11-like [Daphnia pulicaria]
MRTFVLSLPFLIGLLVVATLGVVKTYLLMMRGECRSTNNLTGKTVIITGANTGIGKETAIDLAKRGARVILACRDTKKALAAKDDIVRESGNDNVIVRHLDLASLWSVRQFASEILKNEPRLDILINNAGCVTMEKKLTPDGLEYQMQANHFGHFLLTNLLLELLKKSAPSRIINVSSCLYTWKRTLDLNNLNSELSYNNSSLYHGVYYNSKLVQVLCTRHLAPLISQSGVTVNSVCPGLVNTEIFRSTSSWFQMAASFVLFIFSKVYSAWFLILQSYFRIKYYFRITFFLFEIQTAKEGAQTSIHVAVASEISDVTGQFFCDCRIIKTSKLADNPNLAKKVWEISETCVDLQPEERNY